MQQLSATAVVHTLLYSHWPSFIAWIVGAVLTLFVPLIKWGKDRRFYYNLFGKYIEYEQAQRAYQQAQENNNNNNQNNDNNNNSYGTSPYNCRWWQFRCQRDERNYLKYYAYNNNGDQQQQEQRNGENQIYMPRWYQWLGGRATEEDRREQEERGEQQVGNESAAIKFVYWWSLLLFVSLVAFGGYMLYKKRSLHYVAILLACLTQYALLMMLLVPQGVIMSDNRDLEDSYYGWYGQWGVLMVYFYYGQVLFGVVFLVLGAVKIYYEKRILGSSHSWGESEIEPSPQGEEEEAGSSYKNADKVMYMG